MISRSRALLLYIAGLAGLTAGVLGWTLLRLTSGYVWTIDTVIGAALLVVVSVVSSQWRVHTTRATDWVMGAASHMVVVVLLPTPVAVPVVATAKLTAELWQMRNTGKAKWKRVLVNFSGTVLAIFTGSMVFRSLDGSDTLMRVAHGVNHLTMQTGPTVLIAFLILAATAVAYHEINVLVVVGAITLSSREMPWSVFASVSQSTFLPEIAVMLVGILIATLWVYIHALALLAVIPLVVSLRAFKAMAHLQSETVEAVLTMAESIDYRDNQTAEHSKRLAEMSVRLAQLAGLTPDHAEDIRLAARVHDLGKIGIGNDVLLKQGRLTPEEMAKMRQHPVIGETILASFTAFRGSLAIVRHHHEQWDGRGYPDGLKGEQIPIGARIVSIVDAFDAMTADRPYRDGMPVAEAIERLKAGMGTQFDPRLCGLFIQMLVEDGTYVPMPMRQPELRIVGENG